MHDFVETLNDNIPVRKNFNDVAVFINKKLSVGENIIDIEMPHSITSFMIYGIVTTSNDILIYDKNDITIFQEYFMKLYYPVNIKVGEIFELVVAIHSYANISSFIKLKLNIENNYDDDSKQLVRITPELDHLDAYCIQPNIQTTIKYNVEFLNYHNETFDISADLIILSKNSKPLNCDDDYQTLMNVDLIYVDRVQHTIKIKPSGQFESKTLTFYHCYNETKDEQLPLLDYSYLKSACYMNTETTIVEISGNVIGFDIDSIERMIIMPYGCGEQNIAIMASVVSALELLEHSKLIDLNNKEKARNFLIKGLQNQLAFRLNDGSFTIFQGLINSPNERLWLSVYVYHFLNKCSKYISIEPEILNLTKHFILSMVNTEDLCESNFNLKGFVNYNQQEKNSFLLSFIVYSICSNSSKKDICDKLLKCVLRGTNFPQKNKINVLSSIALLKYDLDMFKTIYTNIIEQSNKIDNYKNASIIEISFALEFNTNLMENNITIIKEVQTLTFELFKLLLSKQKNNDAFGTTLETNFAINSLSQYIRYQKLMNGWMHMKFSFYNINKFNKISVDSEQNDMKTLFFDGNLKDKNLFKRKMIKGNFQKVNISYMNGDGCNSIKITSSCYSIEKTINDDYSVGHKQPLYVELIATNHMLLKFKIKLNLLHSMEMPIIRIERPSGFAISNVDYDPPNYFFKFESKDDFDYLYFDDLPITIDSSKDTNEEGKHMAEIIYELRHIVLNQTVKNIQIYEFYNEDITSYKVTYSLYDKLMQEITNVN